MNIEYRIANRKTTFLEVLYKISHTSLFIIMFLIFNIQAVAAQSVQFEEKESESVIEDFPNPRTALLVSFLVPGLGHNYVDSDDWSRGKIHLGAEIALLVGYFGLRANANRLQGNLNTLARSKAGVSLNAKGREFELAVANFDNLGDYNDYQLRSRRWQNVLPDTPENKWDWQTEKARLEFQDTRDRIGNSENQLPALLSLMVANRLLSGINAFTKARNMNANVPEVSFSYLNEFGTRGATAHLRFSF